MQIYDKNIKLIKYAILPNSQKSKQLQKIKK